MSLVGVAPPPLDPFSWSITLPFLLDGLLSPNCISGGKTENRSRGSSVSGLYESNGSGCSANNRSRVGSLVALDASRSDKSSVDRKRCATLPSIIPHVSVSFSSVSWSAVDGQVSTTSGAQSHATRRTITPLANLHLPDLLLQALEGLPELAQVPALFPSLLKVLVLGFADRCRFDCQEGFVLGVPG